MCYIIEYQYYSAKEKGLNFPIIFGCLFLLFAVYYFSTTNVQLEFSQEYIFERKFGSAGTALGEFSQPREYLSILLTISISLVSLVYQIRFKSSQAMVLLLHRGVHWVLVPAVLLIHLELQQIL
jgi:hypothetical protein